MKPLSRQATNVRGLKVVNRTWLIVYPIGLSLFFVGKWDLDRRRLKAVKEKGVYGAEAFKKTTDESSS